MTDFRNYIYRLAEGVSSTLIWDQHDDLNREVITDMITTYMVNNELQDYQGLKPTKTPAGWRYDA